MSNKEKKNYLKWMKQIISDYKSGLTNQFIINGNISDYVKPKYKVNSYMMDVLVNDYGFEHVITYIPEHGFKVLYSINSDFTLENSDFEDVIRVLGEYNKTLFFLEYPSFVIGNNLNGQQNNIVLLHSALNNTFATTNNIFVFLTESTKDIHPIFLDSTSKAKVVTLEYPNTEERKEYVNYLLENKVDNFKLVDLTVDEFVQISAGLSRWNIENIFLQANYEGLLAKKNIMELKKELIKKEFGEVIEIYDADGYNLDQFIGQEHIKKYHREVVIEPMINGKTAIVPKGILYMGPPGTGKTYFSRCIAGEAGINFVEFKMSKILDKYVGQAERNLEKALRCFESLAPVGIFIDEIDQVLTRGGDNDGNNVNKNLFGMFLSFLSVPEHRGKILWLGATNYPNKLDEALKRAGRFDKKIPFLPPTETERYEILKIHLKKQKVELVKELNDAQLDVFYKETEWYTQAEIESIVVKSIELMARREKEALDVETLMYAISCMVTATKNKEVENMKNIALEECNDLEFLPKKYHKRM